MNRAEHLAADFVRLGELLAEAEGSAAAAIARERRLISEELERLSAPEETSLVDELAAKRSGTGARRPPSRRRKSG